MITITEWSEPFHGVTHIGTPDDVRWATVEDCGGYAHLMRWMKGEGFSCRHGRFPSVEEAKAAGEAWVQRGV